MIPEPLVGEKVVLRPWEPGEAGQYVDLRDEMIFRYTTERPDLDPETARHNITMARTDPNLAPFAVCDRAGRPVGNIAVGRMGRHAAISYWLAPEARGRGWASDALRTGSAWATMTWEVEHLELEIDPQNEASMKVAAAAGYRRHGIRLESACGGPALLFRHP
jgi:RimJ/RimL family protein N-acetyltransferase